MMVETGAFINQMKNDKGDTDLIEMKDVKLPSIRCDLVPFYLSGTRRIFPLWVEIERIDM
jgi:arylsulfatase